MIFQEAKQHLARKLDIDYSDIANNDLWNDTDLGVFIILGILKAWDRHPWPFTQKTKTATTNSDGVTNGYYDHPSDLMNGSIYLLKVGGKEYKKLIIVDYLKYLEDYPNATDKFWSETETYIFINKNAYTVGDTLDLYGKKLAAIPSGNSDILPFSPITDNSEHSGNEAIVQFAYAEALDSEKLNKRSEAEIERTKAYQTLELLWEPFKNEQALLQSKNRPMFEVGDFFGGTPSNKGNQFTGNFKYLN